MIACSLATAHILIHADVGRPVTKVRAQQQVTETKPCIPLPSGALAVPERADALAGMQMADCVSPSPAEKPSVGGPALWLYRVDVGMYFRQRKEQSYARFVNVSIMLT
jgi:hypothetical protein